MAKKDICASEKVEDDSEVVNTATDAFDFVPRAGARRRGGDGSKGGFKLRACISCRLVMSEEQFYERGCGNCAFLQMDGDKRRTFDCTTANFHGLLSVMDPVKSWAARYNNIGDVIPGCYAISVVGELPEEVNDFG